MKYRYLLIPGLLMAGLYFGPAMIHLGYRFGTEASEREENKVLYNQLANQVARAEGLSEAERAEITGEKNRVFLWFHARGWNIDEGWHESALGEKRRHWRELFQYWEL